MTISKHKGHLPTTTVSAARLCIFQETRRPEMIEKLIETPRGLVRVVGKLGQAHADVFEAICFEREIKSDLEDGRIKLLVDPYKVQRRAGLSSRKQLDKITDQLEMALIEIYKPEHLSCKGHLIDHIEDAKRRDGSKLTRRNPLGGERSLWRVELGKAFCTLVERDIWLGYDPGPLTKLDRGISQAIARHVLTHKNVPAGGWKLDGLIEAVAGKLEDQQLRDRRREIRADAEKLAGGLGIVISGDRVTRRDLEGDKASGQAPDDVEQTPDEAP